MKRDKFENTLPRVKAIKTWLTWNECRFCKKEFRREEGFEIYDVKPCRGSGESPYYTFYCCNECATTADEVVKKVNERKLDFIFRKPPHSETSGVPGKRNR